MEEKKLYRASIDKKICGVCGGIAEYFKALSEWLKAFIRFLKSLIKDGKTALGLRAA